MVNAVGDDCSPGSNATLKVTIMVVNKSFCKAGGNTRCIIKHLKNGQHSKRYRSISVSEGKPFCSGLPSGIRLLIKWGSSGNSSCPRSTNGSRPAVQTTAKRRNNEHQVSIMGQMIYIMGADQRSHEQDHLRFEGKPQGAELPACPLGRCYCVERKAQLHLRADTGTVAVSADQQSGYADPLPFCR